jgi:hypothetical protein
MIFALLAASTTLRAADVRWDDLCGYADSRPLTIAMTDGSKVAGTCSQQTAFNITLRAKDRPWILVRKDIASIRLDNHHKSHCMANIGSTALMTLIYGLYAFESPYFFLAPVFLAGAPAILAGGPPFCAVYDLVHLWGGSEKITII